MAVDSFNGSAQDSDQISTANWTVADFIRVVNPDAFESSTREDRIKTLTDDSRKVSDQTVFFAVPGATQDGHAHLRATLKQKPLAVVVAHDVESRSGLNKEDLIAAVQAGTSILRVADVHVTFIKCLNQFFGNASSDMFVVGVTGTNGKTTTTNLIEFFLTEVGCPTAVMGTIDHHLGSKIWDTALTTPGPEELHRRFAEFRQLGAHAVAMEVSSHALAQGRTLQLDFDACVFTNLTRDHLDYHKNLEGYRAAKELLFSRELKNSEKLKKRAILNGDDPTVIKTVIDSKIAITVFGQTHVSFLPDRNLKFKILERTVRGFRIELQFVGEETLVVQSPLVGDFNVENVCAAVGVLDFYLDVRFPGPENTLLRSAQLKKALARLPQFSGVRGRLQRVGHSSPYFIFVDYAHTDDALTNVLETLRASQENKKANLVLVFGCGGDRDKGKRPLMGAIAAKLSDRVFVTSDNPRTEDPRLIIQDIEAGIPPAARFKVKSEPDRGRAIQMAVESLQPGDILLVAGKGHETYQVLGHETHHFDDVEQIEERLKANA